MSSSIAMRTHDDVARPLPFQMRTARWFEGENGGAAGAPAAAPAAGDPAPAAAAAPPASTPDPAPQTDPDPKPTDDNPWNDPDKAKAEIERLRKENGKDRTSAKQKAADEAREQAIREIGKTLGLIKDEDATPDPAKLAEAAQSEAKAAKLEATVLRAAFTERVDGDALLDSKRFTDSLKDVDPTDLAAITEAVKQAATDNPRLRTVQATGGASTADHAAGSGENRKPQYTSLSDAIGAHIGAGK